MAGGTGAKKCEAWGVPVIYQVHPEYGIWDMYWGGWWVQRRGG